MKSVADIQAAKTAELVAFYNAHNEEKPVKKFADRATAEKRCIDLLDSINEKASAESKPEVDQIPLEDSRQAFIEPEVAAEPVKAEPKEFSLKPIHFRILNNIARSDYSAVNGAEPKTREEIDFVWANVVAESKPEKKALADLLENQYVSADNGKGADSCVTLSVIGWDAWTESKDQQSAPEPEPARERGEASNAAGVAASWADPAVKAARTTRNGVTVSLNENGADAQEFKSTRAAFEHFNLPDGKHIRFRMKLKASKSEVFEHEGTKYFFKIVD